MLVNKKVLSALTNALQLGVVPTNPEAIPLIPSIQPVVLVDDVKLVGVIKGVSIALNLDTTAGIIVAGYTAPAGKRAYVVTAFMKETVGTSAIAVNFAGDGGGEARLTDEAAAATFWSESRGETWLTAGSYIGGVATDNIGDVSVDFRAVIVEVDW